MAEIIDTIYVIENGKLVKKDVVDYTNDTTGTTNETYYDVNGILDKIRIASKIKNKAQNEIDKWQILYDKYIEIKNTQ